MKMLRSYICQQGGIATVVFALLVPAIMASAGIAVDMSAAYNARARLSNALDKAVLAVGSSSGTTKELTDRMNAFFNANYPPGKYGAPYNVTLDGHRKPHDGERQHQRADDIHVHFRI